MLTLQAQCVLDQKASLGEGPVWDDRLQELFWVDIEGRTLHRFKPSNGETREYALKRRIGAAVPAEDGTWILALEDGFYRLHLDSGEVNVVALASEEPKDQTRLNDGKCDARGRFYAGTMHYGCSEPLGALYTLEAGGQVTKRLSGVTISNGLAWSADERTMYYIDSAEQVVNAFDYDAESGEISNRRVILSLADEAGGPDGMSIDAEGMLWVCHWGGWQVSRWNPLTGEKLAKVELPAANVTSCAFGGEHLDELYITTARIGNDEQALQKQPQAGGVFKVKLDVKGLPAARFRG
ncbi:SMP-30/gluconolactonase/LRE family protein [Xylanibacillus composti]|uniref:Regucalcin n=1 Tax=Xylanibacillus composti TaxID=1572762 RepID=A0A8J4M4F6_9BACL|nr:SMP-30/gluconolactonase/LRE family protein [Xylanibacillus composti]MDT9724020.1 SMP-30/gluconolactonase/LRE family protein [Xylanibacillus composti]GIQ71075.1 regucalcin-like protein [Xylanibacillus composti]